jgi:hypothetical protein
MLSPNFIILLFEPMHSIIFEKPVTRFVNKLLRTAMKLGGA